jgi:hypothetical protein
MDAEGVTSHAVRVATARPDPRRQPAHVGRIDRRPGGQPDTGAQSPGFCSITHRRRRPDRRGTVEITIANRGATVAAWVVELRRWPTGGRAGVRPPTAERPSWVTARRPGRRRRTIHRDARWRPTSRPSSAEVGAARRARHASSGPSSRMEPRRATSHGCWRNARPRRERATSGSPSSGRPRPRMTTSRCRCCG